MMGTGIFGILLAFGLALSSLVGICLPVEAGIVKGDRSAKEAIQPTREVSRLDGQPALVKLRTGIHPSYTRVVLELSGPADWSAQKTKDGGLLIVVPKVTLGDGIRDVTASQGLLRGVQPRRTAGGVEVRIVTVPPLAEYRTLTLDNPDRLVVDLVRGDTSPGQATAALAASPGRSRVSPPPVVPQENLQPPRSAPPTNPAPQTAPTGVKAEPPAPRPVAVAPPAAPPPTRAPESLRTQPPPVGVPLPSPPPVPSVPPVPAAAATQAQPLPASRSMAASPTMIQRDGPTEEPPATSGPPAPLPVPDRSTAAAIDGHRGAGAAPAPAAAGRREATGDEPWLSVVIDPGHGGHDTGAIGPSGLMEKDVVLDLGFRLKRLLEQRLRIRVLMTRTEDVFVPLADRSAIANRARADFFVSLHVNAAEKRGAVGFETFFFAREPSDSDARASAQRENLVLDTSGTTGSDREALLKMTLADMAVTRDIKESSNLAELVLASLDKRLKVENRGVKSGPFYVLATAAMPAILVESAFITNPREERRLQQEDHRQRVAEALYEGIAHYKARYEQRLGLRPGQTVKVGS